MPSITGSVFYNERRSSTISPSANIGIKNISVALYNPTTQKGIVALTDTSGIATFNNVPAGDYFLIESYGTSGQPSPVDFANATTMTLPPEVDPPISVIATPGTANKLSSVTPNLIKCSVTTTNLSYNFIDGPIKVIPNFDEYMTKIGNNLITAADNGTWGTFAAGTEPATIASPNPYPTATSGFANGYNAAYPNTFNSTAVGNVGKNYTAWWNLSDHTTGLETGRYEYVNGGTSTAAFFTQSGVILKPNTLYAFTVWGVNILDPAAGATPNSNNQIGVFNGSVVLVNMTLPALTQQTIPTWVQIGAIFNSGSTGLAAGLTAHLISMSTSNPGNDFAIDDVELYEINLDNYLKINLKANTQNAYVGDTLTYTITISNTATLGFNPTTLTFKDILSSDLQFVTGSITVNGSATGFESANPNTGFTLSAIATGNTTTVVFKAKILNTAKDKISNKATVTTTLSNGYVSTPMNGASNTLETTIIIPPNLIATKSTDKNHVNIGDTLTYTVNINNPGTIECTTVLFKDTIPANTQFVTGSILVNNSATGYESSNPTTGFNIPNIAGGATTTVTFRVTIPTVADGTIITNKANITGSIVAGSNTYPQNIDSNTTSTVVSIPPPNITVNKSVDNTTAILGDTLTYTININNPGTIQATTILFKDTIPANTEFVTGSIFVNNSSTGYESSNPTTGFNLPNIAGGSTTTVIFKVTILNTTTPNTTITNTSVVTGNITNNSIDYPQNITSNSVNTLVKSPELTINKEVDKSIACPNDTLNYIVTINNPSTFEVTNLNFKDVIPSGAEFITGSVTVNDSSIGFESANPITGFSLSNIPAKGTCIVKFRASVSNITP